MQLNDILPTLALIVAVGVFWLFFHIKNREQNKLLAEQARRRGGTVNQAFLFRYPRLHVHYKTHTIEIHSEQGDRNTPSTTEAVASLALTTDLAMTITKKHLKYTYKKAPAIVLMQDIPFENQEFDSAFLVKGYKEAVLKKILTPAIQTKLLEYAERGIKLSLSRTSLTIVVNRFFSRESDYDRFFELIITILDTLDEGKYRA
ncbi:MAG: DUF3137 domain-containing protein [Nitrospirota bacterium]